MQITRDALYKVVCMILTPSTGKVGTGCFIQKDEVPYLVTAEHVNKLILPDSVIVFGESNSTNHIVLLSGISKGNWQTHPIADLSLTQLMGWTLGLMTASFHIIKFLLWHHLYHEKEN